MKIKKYNDNFQMFLHTIWQLLLIQTLLDYTWVRLSLNQHLWLEIIIIGAVQILPELLLGNIGNIMWHQQHKQAYML